MRTQTASAPIATASATGQPQTSPSPSWAMVLWQQRSTCGTRASVLGPLSSVLRLLSSVFSLALGLCGLGLASGRAATFEELFLYGCRAYAAAGYNQASELFEEALKQGLAPGLLHNLGNAHWQCGRPGQAVLAWERALWLDPYSRNTRANLRLARKTLQLDVPELAWYEICSTWLPVNAWAILAGLSLWIGLGAVWLPGILRWPKADWHQAVAAAGFAVFLLTVPAMAGVHTRSKLAVVLNAQTPLRLTPTKEAQVLVKLPAGDVVRVERQRGTYLYVRAGNEAAGWVQQAQVGLICPR